MIENDLERTEKKVDLFFKIFLGLHISYTDPSNRKYMNTYIDELKEVYDLSAKKDIIESYPTPDKIKSWKHRLNSKLEELKRNYKDGNFLSYEKNIVKLGIKDLENKFERLLELSKNKEKFENKNTQIHTYNLFNDLQKKLGIPIDDGYVYRMLVNKKDDLRNKIQSLIEELHDFIDDKGGIIN